MADSKSRRQKIVSGLSTGQDCSDKILFTVRLGKREPESDRNWRITRGNVGCCPWFLVSSANNYFDQAARNEIRLHCQFACRKCRSLATANKKEIWIYWKNRDA